MFKQLKMKSHPQLNLILHPDVFYLFLYLFFFQCEREVEAALNGQPVHTDLTQHPLSKHYIIWLIIKAISVMFLFVNGRLRDLEEKLLPICL